MQWSKRVEENPEIVLSHRTYRECYRTPLFLHWARYHQYINSKGSGRNAAGKKTEDTYWQYCKRVLLEGTQPYKEQQFRDAGGEPFSLMFKLVAVFARAGREAVERDNNDFGWLAVIRAAKGGDTAVQMKLDRLREHGWGSLTYSPVEGVFGVYDWFMRKCMQMRHDAPGGQAMARWNGTFGGKSALRQLPECAQKFVWLCMRKVVKEERKGPDGMGQGRGIKRISERATKRHRKVKRRVVKKGIRKSQLALSRSAVAFTIEVESRAGMVAILASAVAGGEKEAAMKQVIIAVVDGQSYKKGECQCTCTKGKARKPCKLGCTATIPTTAKEAWSEGGHMREHVLELLRLWEAGLIPRKNAPALPEEVATRGFGDLSLGQRTLLAIDREAARTAKYKEWMLDAVQNPDARCPFLKIDDAALAAALSEETETATLVGKKVEVRWTMNDPDQPSGTFLHCFEGTAMKVVPYAAGRKKELGLDFGMRKPVAKVRWDAEFKWPDSYFPLDLEAYAKENRHFGWNVLTDEYVRAYSTTAVMGCDTEGSSSEESSDDDEFEW